jgi:hypothetical protein
MKVTNKMQLFRLIYYSWSALHVSGDVFAHRQEQFTVFTVSSSIHPSCCRLVSWMIFHSSKTPAGSYLIEHTQWLFHKTAMSDWFLKWKSTVLSLGHELNFKFNP